MLLLVIYPIGLAMVFFCIWWKHKGWTLRDVRLKVADKAERVMEKIRAKRKKPGEYDYVELLEEPGQMAEMKKKKRFFRKKGEALDKEK